MEISNVTKSYVLKDIVVEPNELVLDPHNPRIALDIESEISYSDKQLCSLENQKYILSIINKSEHHIADLIRGIKTTGFMSGTAPIIAKKIHDTNKYKVLEGNRRLTAINYLMENKEELEPSILETMRTLEVKEFLYKKNKEISEEEAIDILLGSIHIKGPLQWGAIEKALYVYRSYMRELIKEFQYDTEFYYVDPITIKVAKFFNYEKKDVTKQLKVYRVYEQLKKYKYPVKTYHYSLIELAVSNQTLSKNYFEINNKRFQFSTNGLERFAKLCIDFERPIRNPDLFKKFDVIYRKGNEYDVMSVESKDDTIQEVYERVRDRSKKGHFYLQLKKIKKLLDSLVPTEYQNTNKEIRVAKEIDKLVKDKLTPLTRQYIIRRK